MNNERYDNVTRQRILLEVAIWARARGIRLLPKKTFELAALVADSEANGISDSMAMQQGQHEKHIERLRKLRAEFRTKAETVPIVEREL